MTFLVDGNLLIRMYDTGMQKKIWEAKAEIRLSGNSTQGQKIDHQAITTMLTNFPPGQTHLPSFQKILF